LELEGNCPLLSLDDTDDLDFGKTKVKEDLSFKYQPFLFKKNIV
jgi:hypothetical protein